MMKRHLTLVALLTMAVAVSAQVRPSQSAEQTLRPQTFRLSNGLTVVVAEDHSEPRIFGAVIVHAGSKNEDTAATGVAHYFEHIMFKGTDRIGTIDWQREKPYIDSISDAYDRLVALNRRASSAPQIDSTLDKKARKEMEKQHKQLLANLENERHAILMEINRLNIEASKYAIANETDAILQQMGCTGLNAGTSYDQTIYYNYLPSNQLENWMMVYAERFRNPVYRLFQGELEAVYEERNLYANNSLYTFSRNLFTESFGEHPYSRDIIGLDEHLKNPQPSAMKKFYDKYYVASNMTLLLVGDLNTAEARQMAEKYFSVWPRGNQVRRPSYQLPRFESRVVKNVKQTPIKAGLMVFPGVKRGDRDELALSIMSELLTGDGGMMNKLSSDGKVMAAMLQPLTLLDAGTNVVIYIPKLLGQKHEEAEELIWECIDSMKTGGFDDALLQAIKTRMSVERKRQMETLSGTAQLLQGLVAEGISYDQWLAELDKLQRLSKADIQRVARQYFDRDHCTIVRSSMGFPKKDAAIKPDWEHLEAQNIGAQSAFAQRVAARSVNPIEPQEIDFRRDVIQLPVSNACRLYATPNPRNDIFSLTIAYHFGETDNRDIAVAADYFNRLGAGVMDLQQYQMALDKLGASFRFSTDYDYTYLTITGLESNLDDIVRLVTRKLHHPRHDKQQLSNMIDEAEATRQAAENDADTWFQALQEYVRYGKQSSYIDHTTIKEMKKMKGEDLLNLLGEVFSRDGYVTFVGNTTPERIVNILQTENLVHSAVTTVPIRLRQPRTFTENEVYYTSNNSFLKSDLSLTIQSRDIDYKNDRAAAAMFNEYMGGGMNSVFFQEIREFRSLGYSTYGYFHYDRLNRYRGFFYGYLGTQCDKTMDGVAAMSDLMKKFPQRKAKFVPSRDYLIATRNSSYIGFRQLPAQVRYWREVERIEADPRAEITNEIKGLRFIDLEEFHQKYVEGRPMVIMIDGNAKKFNTKDLKQYGKVKQLKKNDIMKF